MKKTRLSKYGTRARREAPLDQKDRDALPKECLMCGSERNLELHHIKTKEAFPELRHEALNHVRLCRFHHTWAHDHPLLFKAILDDLYPGRLEELERLSLSLRKPSGG